MRLRLRADHIGEECCRDRGIGLIQVNMAHCDALFVRRSKLGRCLQSQKYKRNTRVKARHGWTL